LFQPHLLATILEQSFHFDARPIDIRPEGQGIRIEIYLGAVCRIKLSELDEDHAAGR
jgi:hypothetical protein